MKIVYLGVIDYLNFIEKQSISKRWTLAACTFEEYHFLGLQLVCQKKDGINV